MPATRESRVRPEPRRARDLVVRDCCDITLHVTLVRGSNVHHIVEAAFKGLGRSLRDAVRIEGGGVPSTKGVLA